MRILCAWYCALLLWFSGMQHLANGFYFFGNVLDYHLVTTSAATLIAAAFPWVHLMLAAALITPGLRSRTPFVATALMGIVFLIAQIAAMMRGVPVDCGCFGGMIERDVGVISLGIAGSLVLAAAIGACLAPSPSVSSATGDPQTTATTA